MNWKNSPPVKLENTHYVVKISNQEEESSSPTVDVKEDLLASSYQWEPEDSKSWQKMIPVKSFKLSEIKQESWYTEKTDGIEINVADEQDSILAKYKVNNGNWEKIFDNIPY